jgi:hypothetical protein
VSLSATLTLISGENTLVNRLTRKLRRFVAIPGRVVITIIANAPIAK